MLKYFEENISIKKFYEVKMTKFELLTLLLSIQKLLKKGLADDALEILDEVIEMIKDKKSNQELK
jgi:hypothetical protein